MLFYVVLLFLGAGAYYYHFRTNRKKIIERLETVVQRRRDDLVKNVQEAKRIGEKLDATRRDWIAGLDFEQLLLQTF